MKIAKTKATSPENNIVVEEIMPQMSSLATFSIAALVLFLLTLFMFGDTLFTSKGTVLSTTRTDLALQFVYWRDFGFSELRHGNLALWNPHIFSGAPYFGGFQSALLYPFNFPYLIMSLPKAINFGIALHVFLMGLCMYLWAMYRGIHPLAALLSAVMVMFSGPYFLHVFAGHLPNLCSMVWAPLIFLSIDGLFNKHRSALFCLLGVFAITMQILAGHPQYFYYTALTAFIYFCILLWKSDSLSKKDIIFKFFIMYIGATAISAIQLLTGLLETGENIRGGGTSYDFAAMFSFPPENIITALAPNFFSSDINTYWGRCYIWEMSFFMSVTGFILAVYGAIFGSKYIRRFSVIMIAIIFILALGSHTPVFKMLYYYLPGFNKFRGSSKFIFQASLFIALLAGIGLDDIIKGKKVNKTFIFSIGGVAVLFCIVALVIRADSSQPLTWWQRLMYAIYATNESYVNEKNLMNLEFIKTSGIVASNSLLIAALTIFVISAFLYTANFTRKIVYAIIFLAIVELFTFGRSARPTFNIASTRIKPIEDFLQSHPGDYRIFNNLNTNSSMVNGSSDIWGNDPAIIKRYAQFLGFTQGQNPDEVTQYVDFPKFPDIYFMLRFKYAFDFDPQNKNIKVMTAKGEPMQRLHLISDYQVLQDRDMIFKAMADKSFDPRKKVFLEETPDPQPIKGGEAGTAKIVNESTDEIIIDAKVPQPAVLLVTDTYSAGWHASALEGSVQNKFSVLPANYVLRAIPLAKGHHRIKLEYMPTGFVIGKWISIIALLTYFTFLVIYARKNKIIKQG